MMQSKINRIQDASIVSSILNAELQVCEREVKGMVYSMRKGWV